MEGKTNVFECEYSHSCGDFRIVGCFLVFVYFFVFFFPDGEDSQYEPYWLSLWFAELQTGGAKDSRSGSGPPFVRWHCVEELPSCHYINTESWF